MNGTTQEIRLDMSGLRLFDIALIIGVAGGAAVSALQAFASSLFEGFGRGDMSTYSGGSIIISMSGCALGIAEIVLIIIGLGRMASISGYFRKARNFYIGRIVAAVCIAIAVIVMIVVIAAQAASGAGMTAMQVTIDVALAAIIACCTALSVLMFNNVFYGCQEISAATGDLGTFEKMAGLKKFYMITLIGSAALICAGLIVLISGIFGVVDTAMASQALNEGDLLRSIITDSAGMIGAVVVIAAGLLWQLVADIIVIVRLWNFVGAKDGAAAAALVTPTDVTLMAPVEGYPAD